MPATSRWSFSDRLHVRKQAEAACNGLTHDQRERSKEEFIEEQEETRQKCADANENKVDDDDGRWSFCGMGSVEFAVDERAVGSYLERKFGHSSDRLPGIQRLADAVKTNGRDTPASLFRPCIRPHDVGPNFDIKAVSKQRSKDRTCYDKHPGVCIRDHALFLRPTIRWHRGIYDFVLSLGNPSAKLGYELFGMALHTEPFNQDSFLAATSVQWFIWSDYNGMKRRCSGTEWRPIALPGNGTQFPVRLTCMVEENRLVHKNTWQLALDLLTCPTKTFDWMRLVQLTS